MSKGQGGLELIIIFSVSMLILILLITTGVESGVQSQDTLRMAQARTAVNELVNAVNTVWLQGEGARTQVVVTIPSNIDEDYTRTYNRSINIRVYTADGFVDVSEVTKANITGNIPNKPGTYRVTIFAREDDVKIVSWILVLNTDKYIYEEGDNITFTVNAIDEYGYERESLVTIELLDTINALRDAANKITINGYASGNLSIPMGGPYGYWTVYAYDGNSTDYKVVLVLQTDNEPPVILNCTIDDNLIRAGEKMRLSCYVTDASPIKEVIYNVTAENYTAINVGGVEWFYELNCSSIIVDRTWISAYAEDVIGNANSTTNHGLPIWFLCDPYPPVINSTSVNRTAINQYEYICINTTVTDPYLEDVWAEVIINQPGGCWGIDGVCEPSCNYTDWGATNYYTNPGCNGTCQPAGTYYQPTGAGQCSDSGLGVCYSATNLVTRDTTCAQSTPCAGVCSGTPAGCASYLSGVCSLCGCDSQVISYDWYEYFVQSTDWAVWGGPNNGFNYVTSSANCVNDGTNKCAEARQGPANDYLYKQSNLDLSACNPNTAYFRVNHLKTASGMQPNDCVYVSFSNNGGGSWGSRNTLQCGSLPGGNNPTFVTVTIPNSYLTNAFSIMLEKFQIQGGSEYIWLDNLQVHCDKYNCYGTPDPCSTHTTQSNCNACGCTWTNTKWNWIPDNPELGYANGTQCEWIPNRVRHNITLSDTGPWCAGSEGDNVYGARIRIMHWGNVTIVAGWANDTVGNYARDLVNKNVTVAYVKAINNKDIVINVPDPVDRSDPSINMFIVSNPNDFDVQLTEVRQTYFNANAFSSSCTQLSPTIQGINFTCTCGSGMCNATWKGNITIGGQNFTEFRYRYTNNNLQTANIQTFTGIILADTGLSNRTERVIDFGNYWNSAHNLYLSMNNVSYAQGINYYRSNQPETFYVMIKEETGNGGNLNNVVVHLNLSSQWTSVSSTQANVTNKGTYWAVNKSFASIPTGRNATFAINATTPLTTQLSVINGTIQFSSVNQTNIRELGILILAKCFTHNDCPGGQYCSNEQTCLDKKSVGGNCSIGTVYSNLTRNEVCDSSYCREDFVMEQHWFCTADSDDCTEEGVSRDNGYKACLSDSEMACVNGVWSETECAYFEGCDKSSTIRTYCGWRSVTGSCIAGTGCSGQIIGSCNDCTSYYTESPFNSCAYSDLSHCDTGCGAECDINSAHTFNDALDYCTYCASNCLLTNATCADPGELVGNKCFYGTINNCSITGCLNKFEVCKFVTASLVNDTCYYDAGLGGGTPGDADYCDALNGCEVGSVYCPTHCINDYDGGSCAITKRLNPSNQDTCYYNRQCRDEGCNLSLSGALRQDYCDYCTINGVMLGEYSPELSQSCNSYCPNNGTRYWDETSERSDDCDGNGKSLLNAEEYRMGYIYPSQTQKGVCDTTECRLDCNSTNAYCSANGACTCPPLVTVFFEDFTPTPYYNYNWTRQGSNWVSYTGSMCYDGDCAHADGLMTQASDYVTTNAGLINLAGASNAYIDFYLRQDSSFTAGDYLRVWCYNSTHWINTYEEDAGAWSVNGLWVNRDFKVTPACLISNARFRITIMADSYLKDLYIDNFRVRRQE